MGSSSSAGELAAKLRAGGNGIERATLEGVREAAIAGKAIFLAELGTRRMSGVGRSGARVGARFTNPTHTANPTSIVMYTGPAHLLDGGTKPHLIGARGQRVGKSGRRLKGKKALQFTGGDGGIRTGPVQHPGTAGKHFFPDARDKVAAVAPGIIRREEHRALARVFGA